MKKKEKPFRNEKGEILRPTIIGYDNKKKQPITQLMTAKERKRFMRRKKKIVNEEKKFIRESKRITTMDMDSCFSTEDNPDETDDDLNPEIQEKRRKLRRWIYQLPQSLKQVGIAVFLCHKKVNIVAQELDLPYSTVSYKVQKIVEILRQKASGKRKKKTSKASYMQKHRAQKKAPKENSNPQS